MRTPQRFHLVLALAVVVSTVGWSDQKDPDIGKTSTVRGTMAIIERLDAASQRPPARETTARTAGIHVSGATAEQDALVAWALSRYDRAGLELPPLEIRFHSSYEPCSQWAGLFTNDPDGATIDICATAEMTLLHELAHAWGTSLSEETIDAFLQLRGLEAWHDSEDPWDEQGIEHQAHIVAWGLLEEPIRLSAIPQSDPDTLREVFEFLTGQAPLHDSAATASSRVTSRHREEGPTFEAELDVDQARL